MTIRWMTRREWLQLAALGGAHAALLPRPADAAAPAAIGVQLYTVRNQLGKDPAATLKAIADIGYAELEVQRASLATVAPIAKQLGLTPVSVHADAPIITGDWAPWREAAKQFPMDLPPDGYSVADLIRDAKAAGVSYLVLPYLLPTERGSDVAYYEKLAARLNDVGKQARGAGLTLCYHNHAFEFAPLAGGRRPIDVLLGATDPDLVKLELDVFWVSIAGADPVALLKEHAARVALVHLKDHAKGAPRETEEARVPPPTFVELGKGAVDIPAVLGAAQAAGVKHYFVEQDHSKDPIASLRESYRFLRHLQ